MAKKHNQSLGHRCEDLATTHLLRHEWRIIARNRRWFGVEIDIVGQKNGLIKIVEVKSLGHTERWDHRLRHSQRRRILFVREQLMHSYDWAIEAELALVEPSGRIHWIPIE